MELLEFGRELTTNLDFAMFVFDCANLALGANVKNLYQMSPKTLQVPCFLVQFVAGFDPIAHFWGSCGIVNLGSKN